MTCHIWFCGFAQFLWRKKKLLLWNGGLWRERKKENFECHTFIINPLYCHSTFNRKMRNKKKKWFQS